MEDKESITEHFYEDAAPLTDVETDEDVATELTDSDDGGWQIVRNDSEKRNTAPPTPNASEPMGNHSEVALMAKCDAMVPCHLQNADQDVHASTKVAQRIPSIKQSVSVTGKCRDLEQVVQSPMSGSEEPAPDTVPLPGAPPGGVPPPLPSADVPPPPPPPPGSGATPEMEAQDEHSDNNNNNMCVDPISEKQVPSMGSDISPELHDASEVLLTGHRAMLLAGVQRESSPVHATDSEYELAGSRTVGVTANPLLLCSKMEVPEMLLDKGDDYPISPEGKVDDLPRQSFLSRYCAWLIIAAAALILVAATAALLIILLGSSDGSSDGESGSNPSASSVGGTAPAWANIILRMNFTEGLADEYSEEHEYFTNAFATDVSSAAGIASDRVYAHRVMASRRDLSEMTTVEFSIANSVNAAISADEAMDELTLHIQSRSLLIDGAIATQLTLVSAQPTLAPTIAPTEAPVIVSSAIVLDGIDPSTFNNDATAQAAMKESLVDSIESVTSPEHVTNLVAEAARRSASAKISFDLVIPTEEPTAGSTQDTSSNSVAETMRSRLVSELSNAVTSNQLATRIAARAPQGSAIARASVNRAASTTLIQDSRVRTQAPTTPAPTRYRRPRTKRPSRAPSRRPRTRAPSQASPTVATPTKAPSAVPSGPLVVAIACTISTKCSCGRGWILPPSTLTSLARVIIGSNNKSVARSYEGADWEGTGLADTVNVTCISHSCTIYFGAPFNNDRFFVDTYNDTAWISMDRRAAKFLEQTSFGPTITDITSLASTLSNRRTDDISSFKAFIQSQIDKPLALNRVWLRQHANLRMIGDSPRVGPVNKPCTVGSRWHRWAFTKEDEGKSFTISVAGDVSTLSIDGARRTEVVNFGLDEVITPASCENNPPDKDGSTTGGGSNGCQTVSAKPGFFYWNTGAPTTGHWLKLIFSGPYVVRRFAWSNRGFPRNIKGLRLDFSDGSSQTFNDIPRRSVGPVKPDNGFLDYMDMYRPNLTLFCAHPDKWQLPEVNGQAAAYGSCTKQLTPVTSSYVKFTVTETWGGRKGWTTDPKNSYNNPAAPLFTDFGHQGAYQVKLWGFSTDSMTALQENSAYKICTVDEINGGQMTAGAGCAGNSENPLITFADVGSNNVQEFGVDEATTMDVQGVPGARVITTMSPSVVAACSMVELHKHMRLSTDATGAYWKHDPGLVLMENTPENPASVDASATFSCPSVPRTFLNRNSCVRRPSCMPQIFSTSTTVTLNDATLQQWYQRSARLMYYVTGLKLEAGSSFSDYGQAPCKASAQSRWKQYSTNCATAGLTVTADADSTTTLSNALSAANSDSNPHVRDLVLMPAGTDATCNNVMGMVAEVSGLCWQHVHPDEYEVIDFTMWAANHPGNSDAKSQGKRNPITKWAETNLTNIQFPTSHADSQWNLFNNVGRYGVRARLGRFGDTVVFNNLPELAKTPEMAQFLGASISRENGEVEVCGSPGEVANNNTKGRIMHFFLAHGGGIGGDDSNQYWRYSNYRDGMKVAWVNNALSAPSQLRHRIAWAMMQIWTVAQTGPGEPFQERWLTYIDIFVRNAFGNLRNILTEVAYNPLMGEFLSYIANKGLASSGTYPDENMAREMMQLFTIGLYKLNDDGTPKRDVNGTKIATYDNNNVMSFARIWTGFDKQPMRANIEYDHYGNFIDPMLINTAWKDSNPKPGLGDTYIGDQYALCTDLPPNAFLRAGARYIKLGTSSGLAPEFELEGTGPWLSPGSGSQLYIKLCDQGANGICRFPDEVRIVFTTLTALTVLCKVTLDATLTCDGTQCDVDTISVLKMVDRDKVLFYRYVSIPCVHLSYYANAKTVRKVRPTHVQYNSGGTGPAASRVSQYCANPLTAVGGALCCVASGSKSNDAGVGGSDLAGVDIGSCKYKWETVKYATMVARCSALGRQPCGAYIEGGITSFGGEYCGLNHSGSTAGQMCRAEAPICYDSRPGNWGRCYTADANWTHRFQYRAQTCSYVTQSTAASQIYSWTTQPCTLQTQVSSTGQIFIVQSAENLLDQYSRMSGKTVAISVPWYQGRYPAVGSTCATTADCVEQGDTCLCNITETTTAVFTDNADVPTLDQVYRRLHIGHPDVTLFDPGTYTRCSTSACNSRTDVEVYLLTAHGAAFDTTTVFKIVKHARILFLANKVSKTMLGGGTFSFRTPVTFMEKPISTVTEAENEMSAYLDHLFYQPELPPFICYRLIQRLVTSNPSPRYIETCVDAFKTGTYDGVTYSGKYGDLKATTYAILLDVEARSFVLEGDSTAGRIREPILKVLHVYRSLNFAKQNGNRAIDFNALQESIGQQFGYAPSVFGFYQPTYSPDGPIGNSGLVAPESQLGTTPFHIGFMNGITGLIQYGMAKQLLGFGTWAGNQYQANYGPSSAAYWSNNQGELARVPNGSTATDVVGELDILLTRGRLNSHAKSVIQAAYDAKKDTNPQAALRDAQVLVTASQEFHATNLVRLSNQLRQPPTPQVPQGRPYKAIVYIFQNGGADSYNLIMPHTCSSVDLYAQYAAVRSPDNYPKSSMRTITASNPNPCSMYGINTRMELLETLFETSTASEGGATIVLNAGAMVEPLTKAEYKAKTKRVPPGLFGHFEMQKNGQNLHAQDTASKGILGRTTFALSKQDNAFKTEMYSLAGNAKAVEGGAHAVNIISPWVEEGVPRYAYHNTVASKILDLYSNYTAQSVFAETHAIQIDMAFNRTELLGSIMGTTTTTANFPTQNAIDSDYRNAVSMQLKQVAKIIKLRGELGTERDAFFVEQHGWDTHFDMQLGTEKKYSDLDLALKAFHSEMKTQGIWDNVVVLTGSDFSRTLTSNGRGTDHGWGGHYFMIGGKVKQQILGTYPEMHENSEHNLDGRGRMLPVLPWESMWNGVLQWFGVESENIPEVLPNKANFPESRIFTQADLFNS